MYRIPLSLTWLLVAVAGCHQGPYEVAPVSGKVTLSGQPLANATVIFEPRGGGETEIVGPGSMGTTDSEGEYRLTTFKDERGAVVGTHRVRVTTFKSQYKDIQNSDDTIVVSKERVPRRYNRDTQLTFEVPSGGTDEANFELEGK